MATDNPALQNGAAYIELRREVEKSGLMNPRPAFYIGNFLFSFGLVAASIVVLFCVRNPLVQLANAGLLAFALTQIAFLGHDLGHSQVFRTKSANSWVGFFLSNLVLGVSFNSWIRKHGE